MVAEVERPRATVAVELGWAPERQRPPAPPLRTREPGRATGAGREEALEGRGGVGAVHADAWPAKPMTEIGVLTKCLSSSRAPCQPLPRGPREALCP